MNWTEVTIYTTTEGIEPLTACLMELGIRGFVIEDPKDFDAFLQETTPHWDYIDEELMASMEHCEPKVKLYVADNPQGMEELAAVRELLVRLRSQDSEGLWGRLELDTTGVNEEDWSTAWKKYYHPIRVGKHLLVRPCWEEVQPQPEDVVVTLDPGMAFGTGTHATTRLCMALIEEYLKPGVPVLDVGCGSGILAITAALLGAKEVTGCDIDEVAVKVAGENAQLNGVDGQISFHKGDLTSQVEGSFGLICANIVADVIIRLCEDVLRYLAPGGVFIASGIIDTREEDVRRAMEKNGIRICKAVTEGGWVAMACQAAEDR